MAIREEIERDIERQRIKAEAGDMEDEDDDVPEEVIAGFTMPSGPARTIVPRSSG